jgi:hypothetical protein
MADNAGVCGSNLHHLWDDLRTEREDHNLSRFRKLEALLGSDPDELDPDEVENRLDDARFLGEGALGEVAIGSVSEGVGLSGMFSAQQISEITNQVGFEIRPEDGVNVNVSGLPQWGSRAAWRIGVGVANIVRDQEKLGHCPLTDDVLANLAGTCINSISEYKQGAGFSWVLRQDSEPARVALRSKWTTSRRFELARLLGDRIFAESFSGNHEPLNPATRSNSYRQKAQRAFAAELLSPWPAVKEMLGTDYSEENQEHVADHFSVSPRTVSTLLINNDGIRDEDRVLL